MKDYLKFIIDTGATHSIVNPGLCDPKWKIKTGPLTLKTLQNRVETTTIYRVPLFSELGDDKENFDLIECKFHDYYDGIIGNDVLKRFGAIIDYTSDSLMINDKKIPLFYAGTHTVQFIIPEENGLVHFSEQRNNTGSVILKEGIYNVQNFKLEIQTSIDSLDQIYLNTDAITSVNSKNFYIVNEEFQQTEPILQQIRTSHMNSEEKSQILRIIKEYQHVFYEPNSKLTFTGEIKHKIDTIDNIPICTKTYRYPYIHKDEVQKQIQEMLDNGIIRHSSSPYSAPIWIVPKKEDASGDKKWRLVVDYRKLNEVTINDRYPIPNIDEILDKLGKSMYFTTLDLAKGFYQIEVEESDVHKTAFTVEGGHYEFLRMPFGLKTAPATFQRLMNTVLKDYINKICLVYLDDIIIFSTSLQEHIESLKLIFNCLQNANLKVQLDKSEFCKRETQFLGHIVTQDGVKPNPSKVECVVNFPIPKTPKQIKQFLGLTGYYRKFIKDYSHLTKPMTKYLKKDAKLNIVDPSYLQCFETLKKILTNDPILVYPDFSKIFTLTTDASNYALGAVLSQNDRPICFGSRTLNEHEINYSTIEKELLAIVWATKYFRPYLFGRKFIIETDHKPLTWLFSIKEPNSKLVRWRLKLSEFDYEIRYKKGTKNGNADALSRIRPETAEINTIEENTMITECKTPINFYKNQTIIRKITSGSTKIRSLTIFGKIRKIFYFKELDRASVIKLLKTHFHPTQVNAIIIDDPFFNIFSTTYSEIFSNDNGLKIVRCTTLLEDIEDELKLTELIKAEHLDKNHRGIQAVYEELKLRIYNPKLKLRTTQFINNCEVCNIEKYDRNPPKIPLQITDTPSKPREIIHIDVFYSLNKSLFMTSIDKFSKYAMAYRINGRSWTEFKVKLLQMINTLGKMDKIIVDNELGFKAIPMQQFLTEENIEIHYTSNSNHTSNADIERLHNTINEHLRLLRHDDRNNSETIEEKMIRIIGFYNNTIHSTTGHKPIDFINGKIHEDSYKGIHDLMVSKKEKTIHKRNEGKEDVILEDGTNFIKEIRGGKNHRKYRKIDSRKIDNDHIENTVTKLKYYKTHVKPKKQYQDRDNPTITT